MSSLLKDPFQAKLTIRRSQSKLRKEMKDLVNMRATGSKYGALKRQDKRRAEYHHDRMTEEKSLQEDLRRAETMAKRVAQVLEQLRKDFNKMKNFVGNYNFTNTVGMDSESTGACESDLSTAIDTRAAWKKELKNLIEMAWHYVDAQYLGNYAVLHTVAGTDSNGSCSTVSTNKSCCPLVYRPAFHYITPAGDCLSMPSSAGEASGDANSPPITSGNTVDNATDTDNVAVDTDASSTDISNVTPAAEQALTSPSARNHNQVTNCDIALRNLYHLIVNPNNDMWKEYLKAEIAVAKTTHDYTVTATDIDTASGGSDATARIGAIVTYLKTTTCLPETFVDAIHAELSAALEANLTELSSMDATVFTQPKLTTILADAPHVDNIEDEPDLPFIIKMLTERMNLIRKCQITNDREQQRIQYVRETSECNQAFHQVEFDRLTGFEESEVQARYAMGVKMSSDLDELHKEHSVSKQTFFNDITLKGCCW
jgi:hypothetical protein